MGEMADYYHELSMIEELETELSEQELADRMWKTNDGRLIRVDEMGSDHIINTIRAFNRGKIPVNYRGGKDYWIKRFNDELTDRGAKDVWMF